MGAFIKSRDRERDRNTLMVISICKGTKRLRHTRRCKFGRDLDESQELVCGAHIQQFLVAIINQRSSPLCRIKLPIDISVSLDLVLCPSSMSECRCAG